MIKSGDDFESYLIEFMYTMGLINHVNLYRENIAKDIQYVTY